jgi:hypothetical protein
LSTASAKQTTGDYLKALLSFGNYADYPAVGGAHYAHGINLFPGIERFHGRIMAGELNTFN